MTKKTLLMVQMRPCDETGKANRTQRPALSLPMERRDGKLRGPALLSSTAFRQLAILIPILGAMLGGCATLKGGGYQEAQVEEEATVFYLQRSLQSYLADSTLVAETRSTMQDSWHTFKNTLDAVLQSMPELDTIPAAIDSMRVATETREDAWRAASARMETNALAVNRADSAHLASLSQYEYQLLNAAGDRSALDAEWARHAPSLQAYQASFDTLIASVLAADSAELNWHAAYIDYVKVMGAVSASSADVTARLAMSILNENAYDAARAAYTQARNGWKTSAWRYHVFAKERQLAARTQVALNDRVTFGGVLRAAGGAALVAGATAGALVGDVATATSLVASAEEMFGSDAAREEDAKAAAYDLARAERRAAADRGATTAELMAADATVVAARDEWRAATESARQERIANREAVMAANLQAQEDMLREMQAEIERRQLAEIPPSTTTTIATTAGDALHLMEERTSCVRLVTAGPEWRGQPGDDFSSRQVFAWGYINNCSEKVIIVAAHRTINSSGELDWFTRTHGSGLEAGAETGIGFDMEQSFFEKDWGRRSIPTPLVVFCAATFESVDDDFENKKALDRCRDNKMR